jgi:hypothetical protein
VADHTASLQAADPIQATESVLYALRGELPDNVYNMEVIPRWQSRIAGTCRWAAPPALDGVTGPLIEEVLAMSDTIGLVAARNLQCHERAFQQRREEHGSHA